VSSILKRAVSFEEVQAFASRQMIQLIPSRFKFLNVHMGPRPGLSHGLLGTPGSGKSTLVKSVVTDTAKRMRTLCFLSEETVVEYQAKLNSLRCNMENMYFMQEKDLPLNSFKSLDAIVTFIREALLGAGIQAFFWDNLTTSKIYESLDPKMQGYFFSKVQRLCNENDILFFYVAHTKQGISDNHPKFIEGEDMRGSSYPFNQSEYFYIYQRFLIGTKVYGFIHVRKHRFHEVEHKFYLLDFNGGVYAGDVQLEFNKLNEFFRQRNYLGKKEKSDRRPASPRREGSGRDGDRDNVPLLYPGTDPFC
jgi:hypothetical protein